MTPMRKVVVIEYLALDRVMQAEKAA